jgi:hypothetical protein
MFKLGFAGVALGVIVASGAFAATPVPVPRAGITAPQIEQVYWYRGGYYPYRWGGGYWHYRRWYGGGWHYW